MVRVLRSAAGALLAALCAILFAVAPAAADTQKAEGVSGAEEPVVVVGFSGLLWRDITPENTPNLYYFLDSAAGANIVTRTVEETTCPSEGWLTIGAGQRAIDPTNGCQQMGAANWDGLADANRDSNYKAELGLLGDTLEGRDLAAIGPGGALALTDSGGEFTGEYRELGAIPGSVEGTDPYGSDPESGAAGAAFADVAENDLVAIDLGAIRYPGDELSPAGTQGEEFRPRGAIDKFLAAFKGTGAPPAEVVPQAAALDARFGAVMDAVDELAPDARILVVSVGDAQTAAPQLGFMSVREGGAGADGDQEHPVAGGELASSDATRQPGLVQLTDVFPTLVSWLEPDAPVLERVVGSQIQAGGGGSESGGGAVRDGGARDGAVRDAGAEPAGAPESDEVASERADGLISRLADDQERSENVRPFVGPFYVVVLAMASVAGVVALKLMRRRIGAPVPRGLSRFVAWVAALPVASLLINALPWWRFAVPGIALFVGIGLIAALIAAVAYMLPRNDKVQAPIAIIGAITAITLIVDVLLDSATSHYSLQLSSLLGTQPQVGGRFYGLSNASFAIMAAGLILAISYVAARLPKRAGIAALVVTGIAVVIVDGTATLGADFGGPPALVLGFVLAGLLIYGVRLTPWWILGTLLAAGATSLLFSFVDYLRPATERSHLGRFIQTVLDGGGFDVVTRKLSQSLFGLPWWLAVIVFVLAGAIAILWWYRRTPRPSSEPEHLGQLAWQGIPLLRHTTFPVIATLVFGMVINDSGVVIPAIGMTVAGLLWAAGALEHAGTVGRASA
ncbi:hypothetical protein [Ancrocorticia sp.]|uniref:hypothetical protein n=1 Tax=Ancrocorticia sp. TaxID=2593684 RepID=UPI003F8F463A